MSKRLDRDWVVLTSVDNLEHDRCVDFFARPDGSFGFEEFRKDVEDAGAWTPVQYFAGIPYGTAAAALHAAERSVGWLNGVLEAKPHLRTLLERKSA